MKRLSPAVLGALALAFAFVATPVLAAADTPYTLQLNARGIEPSPTPPALERNGVVFIDVTRATRIFDGLVTFSGEAVRLSIQHSVADFRVGASSARLNGKQIALPGTPFREYGTVYLPITTVVVRLAGARLHIDRQRHLAQILVGPRQPAVPQPPAPSPQVSLSDEGGALQPSLGQALRLTPFGSVDAAGLHVRVDVANRSSQPVVANFASGAQIAFVVFRNGTEVWNSTAGKMFVQSECR